MTPEELKSEIARQMASGQIAKGSLLPSPRDGARQFGTKASVVEEAYRLLLAEDIVVDMISGLFACSPEEGRKGEFEIPYELQRARGQFFSMRREEPGSDFHLKVASWSESSEGRRTHSHDFIELAFATRGSGYHIFQSQEYPVYAGDCFTVLPGEQHTYRSARKLDICNVMFYPELLGDDYRYLTEIPGFRRFFTIEPLFRRETSFSHKLHLSMSQLKACTSLLKRIQRELEAKKPGYAAAARAAFLELVVYVSRRYDSSVQSDGTGEEFGHKERTVAEAASYLEQNVTNDVRLGDVAQSVYMSPSRLQHLFKETTGTSLTDYMLKMRIERACELLRDTDEKVTQIALHSGFHDLAYFTRAFRKSMDKSPSQYRKMATGSS